MIFNYIFNVIPFLTFVMRKFMFTTVVRCPLAKKFVQVSGGNKIWTVIANKGVSGKVPLVMVHGFGGGIGLWVSERQFGVNRSCISHELLLIPVILNVFRVIHLEFLVVHSVPILRCQHSKEIHAVHETYLKDGPLANKG